LINTGRAVVFIDDVMMRTESEKKHDELVEEILRRIKRMICI